MWVEAMHFVLKYRPTFVVAPSGSGKTYLTDNLSHLVGGLPFRGNPQLPVCCVDADKLDVVHETYVETRKYFGVRHLKELGPKREREAHRYRARLFTDVWTRILSEDWGAGLNNTYFTAETNGLDPLFHQRGFVGRMLYSTSVVVVVPYAGQLTRMQAQRLARRPGSFANDTKYNRYMRGHYIEWAQRHDCILITPTYTRINHAYLWRGGEAYGR
jgi:hypothetical protein